MVEMKRVNNKLIYAVSSDARVFNASSSKSISPSNVKNVMLMRNPSLVCGSGLVIMFHRFRNALHRDSPGIFSIPNATRAAE